MIAPIAQGRAKAIAPAESAKAAMQRASALYVVLAAAGLLSVLWMLSAEQTASVYNNYALLKGRVGAVKSHAVSSLRWALNWHNATGWGDDWHHFASDDEEISATVNASRSSNANPYGKYLTREQLESIAANDSLIKPLHNRPYAIAIYIRTAPNDFDIRTLLREKLWIPEAVKYGIFYRFVIGKSKSAAVNERALNESLGHGDMVQFDFVDHYHNLSVKTRDTLNWHNAHVSPAYATVFMWTNHDGMVFPDNLVRFVERERVHAASDTIFGHCTCSGLCRGQRGPHVMRGGKWAMPFGVYSPARYPHYCFGYSVLMAPGTARSLAAVANAKSTRYLMDNWIDDVTYAGIFAQEAGNVRLAQTGLFSGGLGTKGCSTCVAGHIPNNRVDNLLRHWKIYTDAKHNAP